MFTRNSSLLPNFIAYAPVSFRLIDAYHITLQTSSHYYYDIRKKVIGIDGVSKGVCGTSVEKRLIDPIIVTLV